MAAPATSPAVKSSLARRLQRGMDGDADAFALLIDCQDHLVLAARAYVDRLVLESFADAVERAPEGEPRELLARLCDLHALHSFEREHGWFQEHGRFSSTRSKAVVKAVNAALSSYQRSAWVAASSAARSVSALSSPSGHASAWATA